MRSTRGFIAAVASGLIGLAAAQAPEDLSEADRTAAERNTLESDGLFLFVPPATAADPLVLTLVEDGTFVADVPFTAYPANTLEGATLQLGITLTADYGAVEDPELCTLEVRDSEQETLLAEVEIGEGGTADLIGDTEITAPDGLPVPYEVKVRLVCPSNGGTFTISSLRLIHRGRRTTTTTTTTSDTTTTTTTTTDTTTTTTSDRPTTTTTTTTKWFKPTHKPYPPHPTHKPYPPHPYPPHHKPDWWNCKHGDCKFELIILKPFHCDHHHCDGETLWEKYCHDGDCKKGEKWSPVKCYDGKCKDKKDLCKPEKCDKGHCGEWPVVDPVECHKCHDHKPEYKPKCNECYTDGHKDKHHHDHKPHHHDEKPHHHDHKPHHHDEKPHHDHKSHHDQKPGYKDPHGKHVETENGFVITSGNAATAASLLLCALGFAPFIVLGLA